MTTTFAGFFGDVAFLAGVAVDFACPEGVSSYLVGYQQAADKRFRAR